MIFQLGLTQTLTYICSRVLIKTYLYMAKMNLQINSNRLLINTLHFLSRLSAILRGEESMCHIFFITKTPYYIWFFF